VERVVAAYRRAVDEHDAELSPASSELAEPRVEQLAEQTKALRKGSPPHISKGADIDTYSTSALAQLIRWIESDGVLRTEDELVTEAATYLGYRRRGARIVAALQNAVKRAHG
jgi:hypothetical protein